MTTQLLESPEPQAPAVALSPVMLPSPSQRPAPARRIPPAPRPRSHWPGRLGIAAGLLLTAFCLLKGLSSPNSSTQPIAEIAVGTWVRAENPTGEQDFQFGTEVDADTWRHLTLVAPKQDGSRAEVELLRPVSWIEAHAAVVGGTVEISVPECGIEGEADVLAIAPSPQIAPRPGPGFRVVTGRFVHHSARVIDLHVKGLDEPIGTTANHPFWSEDRQQFVRADQLEPGDRLRAFNGTPMVTAVYPRPGPQAVYNLEVQVDHTYHVASSGLLVHNSRPCPLNASGVTRKPRPSAALEGELITGRVNSARQPLDDLFEFANPTLASRQGLGFAEEGHHFWPKWLGGPDAGPLLNVRMGIHRGAGVGMHQRLNDHLVNTGLIPREMINNSAWVRQNLTPSQVKRALYYFYRTNYPNLPGVPQLLSDGAGSMSF